MLCLKWFRTIFSLGAPWYINHVGIYFVHLLKTDIIVSGDHRISINLQHILFQRRAAELLQHYVKLAAAGFL